MLTNRWSRAADLAVIPLRGELGERVHELSRSAADLVAYGAADTQLARLTEVDARLRAAEERAAWTRGIAAGGQLLVMGIAVAAAMVLGGQAVADGQMLGRTLAVLCLTPLALHESFQDLTKAAQTLTHARSGLARIVELLHSTPVGTGDRVVEVPVAEDTQAPVEEDDADLSAGPVTKPSEETPVEEDAEPSSVIASPAGAWQSSDETDTNSGLPRQAVNGLPRNDDNSPVLEFHGLAIGWPDHPMVLENLELNEFPGERVAVTGASGVGKTTLAATIMGLIPPVAGELEATRKISYLAQDAHIFTTTVAENVRIGNPHATDEQVRAALAHAGAEHLELTRFIGEAGSTISGGEARRLALARVLVAENKPDLVILDEPTEHLDQETATALLDDLFAALEDTALLAITHDADVIARCDREFHLG
jgi:ATP-binding cassette subfamily C protein CydCD